MPKSVRATGSTRPTEKMEKTERPKRSIKWRWRSGDEIFGILMIRDGDEESDYLVQQIGKSVFLLTELVPNSVMCYVVNIGDTPNCGCLDFDEGGRCQHVSALRAKREAGEV